MRESIVRLMLAVDGGPEGDVQELGQLTIQLRQRLLKLDVEAVELVRTDEIPSGTKAADVAIGALVITLTPAALKAVVGLVKAWLKHRPDRTATLVIDGDCLELTNASRADQYLLVQAFVNKHAKQ